MNESGIERICRRMALAAGWLCWKIEGVGVRGVPDRVMMRGGAVIFVEFKRPGGVLSPHQVMRLAELARAGVRAHVVDSVDAFRAILTP